MKLIDIKYKGIDIGKVLSIPLYGSVLANLYKAIFHCNSFDCSKVVSDICVIYTHKRSGREDYFQIIENLVAYLKELSPELVVMQPKFSIIDKVRLVKHLFLGLSCFNKLQGSFLYRLYLFILIARIRVDVDYVMTFLKKSKVSVVVTFCDAHYMDNIITQCANSLSIKTVTLQHGQYSIDEKDTPENMALSNLVSNYFCAWGEATCDEFMKIANDVTKVMPLGSLRTEVNGSKPYTACAIAESKSKRLICLMLNADNCLSSNIGMIETINEFCCLNDYKYCVRFHPKNKLQIYQGLFSAKCFLSYSEVDSKDVAFSIIFTSGVMVELLSKGQLFFLYRDKTTPKLFQQNILSFTDSCQLKLMANKLYEKSDEGARNLNILKEYFINTTEVKTQYLTFFRNLMQA